MSKRSRKIVKRCGNVRAQSPLNDIYPGEYGYKSVMIYLASAGTVDISANASILRPHFDYNALLDAFIREH